MLHLLDVRHLSSDQGGCSRLIFEDISLQFTFLTMECMVADCNRLTVNFKRFIHDDTT